MAGKEIFKVPAEYKGKRIDLFLSQHLKDRLSRVKIQKLISENNVRIDGQPHKNNYRLREGQTIEIEIPQGQELKIEPENIPVNVVYEDDDVIVVDKPAGMVVHPAVGNWTGTLVSALLYKSGKLSELGLPHRPGVVHRIDKETSGLLVLAKTDAAYLGLAKQFKNRTISRKYLAIVQDVVAQEEGLIEVPIGRHPVHRKQMAVSFTKGKNAISTYKVIKRFKDFTLVEVRLKTGRTHQIRVHMAYIGHPVLGDEKYSKESHAIGRQALHAATLGFKHPVTGKYIEFESPMPQDMRKIVEENN